MTTVVVLCDPPRPGHVLPDLVETTPLTESDAADLYAALLADSVDAAARSGGEVLVNYRPDDALPDTGADPEDGSNGGAETEVRAALEGSIDTSDVRFEVQVGETFSGRVGNTVTHLLENEGVDSVAVVRPESALLARTDVDGGAMKLRSSEVVLGPAPGGRVHYAGFAEPIDFADAYATPALETLTDRALDAGLGVDFVESKPVLETAADLADVLTAVRSRLKADALVPRHLAEWVLDSGLAVEPTDDGALEVVGTPDGSTDDE